MTDSAHQSLAPKIGDSFIIGAMATLPVPFDKKHLTDAEETLVLLIRTYLQRVSSKLSAAEFVELAKVAISLLNPSPSDQPQPTLSLPERKHLLEVALQTFGTQLSQPIPALGEKIPQHIAPPLARLVRYQKIIGTHGVSTVFDTLVAQPEAQPTTQPPENTPQQLSPSLIRTALTNANVTIAPELDTPDALEDIARVLLFEKQLQTPSPSADESGQNIPEQINQAIAQFKASYQPPMEVTQPIWDHELSVSSPLFTPDQSVTAHNNFSWPPPPSSQKTLEDETNP